MTPEKFLELKDAHTEFTDYFIDWFFEYSTLFDVTDVKYIKCVDSDNDDRIVIEYFNGYDEMNRISIPLEAFTDKNWIENETKRKEKLRLEKLKEVRESKIRELKIFTELQKKMNEGYFDDILLNGNKT